MEKANKIRTGRAGASSPPRRRMSTELRREQIMDAVRDIANQDGFHAVSLDRVAQACGITRTLIYQQFGNLPGLLLAMVDREYDRAAAGFAAASQRRLEPGESPLTAGINGVLNAVDESPETWKMLLFPSQGGPPELYERLEEARYLTRTHLDSKLKANGGLKNVQDHPDPELLIRTLQLIAEDLVRLRLSDPATYTLERLLRQADWASRTILKL